MANIPKKFIWIAVVVILGIGAYFYFSSDSTPTPTSSSGLVAQSGTPMLPTSGSADAGEIAKNTAFISKLLALNKIRIDSSIFSSVTFTSLSDNTVPIVNDGVVGRTNPFASFDQLPPTSSFPSAGTATGTKITIPTLTTPKTTP